MRMTATDTFHTGNGCVSGALGFAVDSSDVVADSIEFVAVFMTVGLLAVPDARGCVIPEGTAKALLLAVTAVHSRG